MATNAEIKQFSDDRPVVFVVDTQAPPRIYANSFQINIQDGEVILRVGETVEHRADAQVARESVTLILSHHTFVKISDVMAKAAEILKTAYGGEVPQLHLSPEMLSDLRAEFDDDESL